MHNEIMNPFPGPKYNLAKIGSPRRWPSSFEPLQGIFLQLVLHPSDIFTSTCRPITTLQTENFNHWCF
jgi:hypothetical protein